MLAALCTGGDVCRRSVCANPVWMEHVRVRSPRAGFLCSLHHDRCVCVCVCVCVCRSFCLLVFGTAEVDFSGTKRILVKYAQAKKAALKIFQLLDRQPVVGAMSAEGIILVRLRGPRGRNGPVTETFGEVFTSYFVSCLFGPFGQKCSAPLRIVQKLFSKPRRLFNGGCPCASRQ